MKRQRTNRQHTVPRNYLSRFLGAGRNTLFVFDKFKKATYENSISNISVENNFYDLPPAFAKKAFPSNNHDHQFLEHGLAKAEGQFKLDVDRFLRDVRRTGITNNYRAMLAPYIVIQYVRGREHRESLLQLKEKCTYAAFSQYCKQHHPDIPLDAFQIIYDRELLPIDQTLALIDSDHIENVALMLLQHIWVVGINLTIQPFYTSDNPVVKVAHVFKPGRSFTGFRSKGIEIAFPLSSTHILVLYERHYHHKTLGHLENGTFGVTPLGVEHFNEMQVKQSYRHVCCERDEFEQAKGVCRRFPEVCDPNRTRIDVEVEGNMIATLCK